MNVSRQNIVTGAFGYTGKYITRLLLSMGEQVKTLTAHPDRENPFGEQVTAAPLSFDRPAELAQNMHGATTLYNTYWIRFEHKDITYDKAVENTRTLIRAAEEAGVERLVHVSITNPSEDSAFGYFRGKAILEKVIADSRLSHAIIRPAVIYGDEGILINNIAWMLRRFPVFAVPGSGEYKLQPIFVEDMAGLAVDAGHRDDNLTIDAVGPEIFTFNELLRLIAGTVGSKARIIHLPPSMALSLARQAGRLMNDIVLTQDEVEGLMANLLISAQPPTGTTRLSDWLAANADHVGRSYASELKRHF
jgi:uncharacterized protein YbjT (DUF2867 family)